jgi:hypothetical protein
MPADQTEHQAGRTQGRPGDQEGLRNFLVTGGEMVAAMNKVGVDGAIFTLDGEEQR